eukprot:scaffold25772_cov136-Isochrysis_galbana.AAC.6
MSAQAGHSILYSASRALPSLGTMARGDIVVHFGAPPTPSTPTTTTAVRKSKSAKIAPRAGAGTRVKGLGYT